MATATVAQEGYFPRTAKPEASSSGVSWPAVWAGAFGAGALSIILMALGTGIGLSALSPWPNPSTSASRISFGAIFWVILVQVAASALGGYLAGGFVPNGLIFTPMKSTFATPRMVFWSGRYPL